MKPLGNGIITSSKAKARYPTGENVHRFHYRQRASPLNV